MEGALLTEPPYRPGELIQVSATVAAVAVALAAIILQDPEPVSGSLTFAAAMFLVAAAASIVGGGYAIVEMLADVWLWPRGATRDPDPVSHINAVGWTAFGTSFLLPPAAVLLLEVVK